MSIKEVTETKNQEEKVAEQAPSEAGHVHGPNCQHHHHSAPKTIVRTGPKVGRNDPCTCGSQKKFKKCCGK